MYISLIFSVLVQEFLTRIYQTLAPLPKTKKQHKTKKKKSRGPGAPSRYRLYKKGGNNTGFSVTKCRKSTSPVTVAQKVASLPGVAGILFILNPKFPVYL